MAEPDARAPETPGSEEEPLPSTPSGRPRGSRGGRGRGGRGSGGGGASLDGAPRTDSDRPPRVEGPRLPRSRGVAGPTVAQARGVAGPTVAQARGVAGPTVAQARRNDGPPGSVEALIARQNVLFEEFMQQQTQGMREMQRTAGTGHAGGGGGGGTAVTPKVGIFLDVPNLVYAAEQMGVRIHYGKLLGFLTEGRQLVRATAYAPVTDDPQTRYEAQRFIQPVLNQGYKIVTKPWKRFADGSMKANFDIELAVDILTMSDRLDVVVLLSGDGDFRRVCELVESKGVRVEVVSFAQSTAMELRAVADSYVDLGQILHLVGG